MGRGIIFNYSKIIFVFFFFLFLGGLSVQAQLPLDAVVIEGIVVDKTLPQPHHHGFLVKIGRILNPNLTAFRVEVRELVQEEWRFYGELKPYNTSSLILPYRNQQLGFKTEENYRIRICPVYGDLDFNPNLCGEVQALIPEFDGEEIPDRDEDDDGLLDRLEYNFGTDPRNPDSDEDDMADRFELHYGLDPTLAEFPELELLGIQPDRSWGNAFGDYDVQHKVITLTNSGDRMLRIFRLRFEQEDVGYEVSDHFNRIDVLEPGDSFSFNLDFLPVKPGPSISKIRILTDDRDHYPAEYTLRGIGKNIANLKVEADQDPIVFENSEIGDTLSFNGIRVSNVNADIPLRVSAYVEHSLGFDVVPRHFTLEPNEIRNLEIVFMPDWSGTFEGQLTLEGENDSTYNVIHYPLKALVGGEVPRLRVNPVGLRFPATQIGLSQSQIFRIHNDGDGYLFLKAVDMGVDEGRRIRSRFKFSSQQIVIPPQSNRPLKITFSPSEAGVIRTQICLVSNDPLNQVNRNPRDHRNCEVFRMMGDQIQLPQSAHQINIEAEGVE